MIWHCIAFLAGFVLDLILGDPHWLPHPIRIIGRGIAFLEKKLNQGDHRVLKGAWMVIIVLVCTVAVIGAIVTAAYLIHPVLGMAVELILTYYALAVRSLRKESMDVYRRLVDDDLEDAKKAVSMIVGRDTERLDESGVIRAAVESVAENMSDGVIAPMLFLAVGGPILGFFYKAANTMDSMVGYKNDRFLLFGRAAARLDDVLNFIPSRITAFLTLVSCLFAGKDFTFQPARQIYRRDRRNHASPNSAQAEAVCAGALGIRLAGNASYFGKMVEKPYIGDDIRPVEAEDIRRINRLMYWLAALFEAICLAVLLVIWALW